MEEMSEKKRVNGFAVAGTVFAVIALAVAVFAVCFAVAADNLVSAADSVAEGGNALAASLGVFGSALGSVAVMAVALLCAFFGGGIAVVGILFSAIAVRKRKNYARGGVTAVIALSLGAVAAVIAAVSLIVLFA